MKVRIVKEVKRSDVLWRFACGDVFGMTGRHWYHKQWLKLVESDYFHTTNNQSRMRLSLDVCCPWACVTLSHKWSGVCAQETNEGHASCGRSLKECNPCDNRFKFSTAFEKHTSPHTSCTAATSSTFQGLVIFLPKLCPIYKNGSWKHSRAQFWWTEPCVLATAHMRSSCPCAFREVEHCKSDIALDDTWRVKVGGYHSAKIKLHVRRGYSSYKLKGW